MSDERNEQYFHGIVSRFTIQDILRVHGMQSTLPAPIANIGFPDGLEVRMRNHITFSWLHLGVIFTFLNYFSISIMIS